MDLKTLDKIEISPLIRSMALKAGGANLIFGVLGLGTLAVIKGAAAPAFMLGLLLGVANACLSMKIMARGIALEPARAQWFVTLRSFLRFALMAIVIVSIVAFTGVNPWALLAGYGGSVLSTTAAIYLIAREECA